VQFCLYCIYVHFVYCVGQGLTRLSFSVLAVGAHPDDVEIGCGGSISCHAKRGHRVLVIYVTKGDKSVKADGDVRVAESREACKILGVKDVILGDFEDTNIPNNHSCIDFLERALEKCKPDIVYTHSINELHQDHRSVGYLSLAAFRNIPKILAYESPRVSPAFSPSYFVDISRCLDLKWKALRAHRSQSRKYYMAYKSAINLATFRGRQVGVDAAEGFEVVRYLQRI